MYAQIICLAMMPSRAISSAVETTGAEALSGARRGRRPWISFTWGIFRTHERNDPAWFGVKQVHLLDAGRPHMTTPLSRSAADPDPLE